MVLLALFDSPWMKPLGNVAIGTIAAVAGLWLVMYALRAVLPKVAAIAWSTGKEAISQPLFYILLFAGLGLLLLAIVLPYYTFGEDTKVFEENCLTLIMLLSVVLALWTASVSIADELEGRTALTVLSKPISRRDFIIGKFLGILGPVALVFIIQGAFFLCCLSFKVMYDARESSQPEPTSLQCQAELVQMLPGLILAFMEATVLTAISVAISTRLAMLPNLVICVSIYVLGHLVPQLALSAVGQIPTVAFFADLLSTVLPVLDHFNIYGAISSGQVVPTKYLGFASAYCLLYSTIAMLFALLLFEDRDLA